MDVLGPLRTTKYSPLQASGDGLQSVYLAEVPQVFAEVLAGLIGPEAQVVTAGAAIPVPTAATQLPIGDDLDYWEHKLEQVVVSDTSIPDTTREAIIRARVGQGKFKQNVLEIEHRCRLTGVDQLTHLVASHIRPWRDSSNEDRLDGETGLLLTPNIDHLFDRGFIGFEDKGTLIISPVAHRPSL